MSAKKKVVTFDSPGMKRVLAVLKNATTPMRDREIAKLALISERTFSASYRQLLLKAKKIHVAAYEWNTRGPVVPLYAYGPLVGDPPEKPGPKPQVIAQRAWRERTGYYESIKSKNRLRRPPDAALAALLGIRSRHSKPKNQTERNPSNG